MKKLWPAALVLFSGCLAGPVAVAPVAQMAVQPARPRTVLVERARVAPAPTLSEGLEALQGWAAVDPAQWQGVNASEARYVEHGKNGRLLLVRWKGEGRDKAAVSRVGELKLPPAGALRFRTYSYADHEVAVALGFFAGEERKYFETPTVKVPPKKWADHAFDLGMNYFKCAASNWKHASALEGAGEVKELVVLVYDRGSGSAYVDAIRAAGE